MTPVLHLVVCLCSCLKTSEAMRKMVIVFTMAVLLLSSSFTYAQSLPPIPGTLSEKVDPLKKIYSELKVGMTFKEVRNLAEKHYPNCQLQDTDVWEFAHDQTSPLAFSWVLGIDRKLIRVNGTAANLHRVVLRLDFDDSQRLINAVYSRANTRDFKKIKKGATEFAFGEDENLALVGDGYYKK